MSEKPTLFELKEVAKWSHDIDEKRTAIKELTTHGENAVASLEEILNITASEDIKTACIEAIKAIRGAGGVGKADLTSETPTIMTATATKHQKKEEKEGQGTAESEPKLADLPP